MARTKGMRSRAPKGRRANDAGTLGVSGHCGTRLADTLASEPNQRKECVGE